MSHETVQQTKLTFGSITGTISYLDHKGAPLSINDFVNLEFLSLLEKKLECISLFLPKTMRGFTYPPRSQGKFKTKYS